MLYLIEKHISITVSVIRKTPNVKVFSLKVSLEKLQSQNSFFCVFHIQNKVTAEAVHHSHRKRSEFADNNLFHHYIYFF